MSTPQSRRIWLTDAARPTEVRMVTEGRESAFERFRAVKESMRETFGPEVELTNAIVLHILLDVWDLHRELEP